MSWWVWALGAWVALSLVVAPVVGLSLREAERRERSLGLAGRLGAAVGAVPTPRPVRRMPTPPIALALVATGITLETIGLVVRETLHDRGSARLFSMDLPLSVPRLFVTGLFVAAAVAALAGASRAAQRRSWWLSVAAVAAVVAQVKGGGTVHVRALAAVGLTGHPVAATAVSAAVAATVLAVLWWSSRSERRDRRRVLGAFALYAFAAVGLSGVSSMAGRSFGPAWSAVATFVEESGEVVGGVAVLVAVLVGVAPRLVLPADWALRRDADTLTVDAPGQLPVWSPPAPVRWS